MLAFIPFPSIASKFCASEISISFVFSNIAFAIGCSDFDSIAPTIFSSSPSFILLNTNMSFTCGFPTVIVPVLSKTIAFIECASSKLSADFINIPFSAAFPVPTIIETGVASPKAQGQDITKTEIPIESANSNGYPNSSQIIVAIIAIVITIGTNTPAYFIC